MFGEALYRWLLVYCCGVNRCQVLLIIMLRCFSGLFEFEPSLHGRLTIYALWTNLMARSLYIYLA